MKTNKMIENWNSTEMTSIIGKSSIDKGMMTEVQGGAAFGHVQTISGECNSSGKSCWTIVKNAVNTLFSIFE